MPEHPSKPIFVSHAVADKEIADKVVDLLNTAMGIQVQNDVFCSSLEGLKIPAGMDFKHFIKAQIQEPKIVILLISQNYLASQFCLAEVGASWAMSHRIIPILVPPIKYDDMKAVLAGVHALKIEDSADWNECLEIVKSVLAINPNTNRWERKRDEKIEEIKLLLPKQPAPPHVPLSKLQEATTKLKEANEEIVELEGKIAVLEKLNQELKNAKDAKDVARIELATMPAAEAFKSLLQKAKDALSDFPGEVWDAFYYHFRGEGLPEVRPGFGDSEDRWDERRKAVEDDYLSETRDGEIRLNDGDPSIKRALAALRELRDFMSLNQELAEPYEEDRDYQFEFRSKRFWEANL